ncbi:MAG: hypothetical protein Rubg2KO_30250 [Rubricoccaceae bacterium]
MDSLASSHAAENGLPSLIVGVIADGERWVAGATDGTGMAPDAHTLFEIGSISKVLTALALADAVVEGEAALETPVEDLLVSSMSANSMTVGAHPGGPIRLVDLATHTSGLPRLAGNAFEGADMSDPYAAYGPDALAAFLRSVEPATPPGSTYAYSNAGAGLLGFALAQNAETSYADLVRQRVLGSLRMEETVETVPDELASRFVGGHGADGQPVPHWTWTEPTAGAGAWRSSVYDMLTLAEAAMDPSSTDLADALALSMQPHAEIGGGQEMGLGWHRAPTPVGALVWHNGGTGGFSSFLGVVPDAGVAVVAITNRSSSVDAFASDLLRRLLTTPG